MTALNKTDITTVPDGWSRDADGKLRMTELQAFRAFSFLSLDPDRAPAYAANLSCPAGTEYLDFLAMNDIHIEGEAPDA